MLAGLDVASDNISAIVPGVAAKRPRKTGLTIQLDRAIEADFAAKLWAETKKTGVLNALVAWWNKQPALARLGIVSDAVDEETGEAVAKALEKLAAEVRAQSISPSSGNREALPNDKNLSGTAAVPARNPAAKALGKEKSGGKVQPM